jgi:hypothetical protein
MSVASCPRMILFRQRFQMITGNFMLRDTTRSSYLENCIAAMSSQSPYSHHDAQTYRRNKPNSRKRSSTTLSNFSRGRQKLDAREQTVRENTTNDESNMFANNGPVSYQIINNHSSASGKAGSTCMSSQ